ncbi:Fur family transcriptional regulator [Streptomyces polygonati]|uniref:Fur family transcriptional regulator n=1 Tax=Streptomyces polygonati TaxID=1617087 RepID=A0ABV8HY68_9ACTN
MPDHDSGVSARPGGDAELPGRRTHQRRSVLDALIDSDGFVSAQSLYGAVRAAGVHLGLSTVYRTLAAFSEAGLADVVRDTNGERLFRFRPSGNHQHYLLCRHCGFSDPVESSAVEAWARTIAETSGFAQVEHTVELTGVCADCVRGDAQQPPHAAPAGGATRAARPPGQAGSA